MMSTSRKISEWKHKVFNYTKIRFRRPEWRIHWKKKKIQLNKKLLPFESVSEKIEENRFH